MLLLLALAAAAPQASGITLDSFVTTRTERFLANDTDKDGRVSLAEWTAARAGAKGDAARQFAAIDTDKDGFLTSAEAGAFFAARFAKLDANGDKVLTRDETQAARQGAPAE